MGGHAADGTQLHMVPVCSAATTWFTGYAADELDSSVEWLFTHACGSRFQVGWWREYCRIFSMLNNTVCIVIWWWVNYDLHPVHLHVIIGPQWQGSCTSWKVLDFSIKFPGPGNSWKMSLVLEIEVLESPGIYLWFSLANMPFICIETMCK